MDKLQALRAFVVVAQSGGFSSAARKLELATSSVTRAVDALEESLGTALLNRTTRQVTLSDAGKTYYLRAQRILEDIAEADAAVTDRGDDASGPLRVSVPVEFARQCISPHIGAFLSRYPKIDLDITLTDTMADLVSERVDLAIRLGTPPPDAAVISRHIGNFSRYVVASHAYLHEFGTPAQPGELTAHQTLRFSYGADRQVWAFCKDGLQSEVVVTGKLKSNNSDILREAALSGAGVALLPSWLVAADVQSERLTRLFEGYEVNPNNARSAVTALYLPNQRGSRRIKAFIELVTGAANLQ
ncbi:LysR family transcriptional regulator [Paraburkholderia silvatlantica]|uniref:DNA-binding transcriptional LysR family regulator n=1 Tax=Paraburkholderia silvatlantica TaxID=321895 RepID=A0ABR6FXX6_9BURK|nr:LysR family transcriptional regulator [Paraburkholderia silvatlantica]MBB2931394.1 DNA-binding transcriptional LysR family regulator [Paraburkholderia silvatlantica]PVY27939.1 LysR family transcriptional regulator [Paraburkholderia silvatlantica]PXW34786.1 LysR family transcriptional regulator [Paraburkholderia silvatlantica]TDQ98652.1 LysR family transcriptional regulator [Paraburkholderia silvatlantica]